MGRRCAARRPASPASADPAPDPCPREGRDQRCKRCKRARLASCAPALPLSHRLNSPARRRRRTADKHGQSAEGLGSVPRWRTCLVSIAADGRPSAARRSTTSTSRPARGIVPFAGWEMPVQYEGVIAEHKAVRTDAGVFDVSHMGEIEVEGPTAAELLQRLLSNDVSRLEVGEAQYTLLTNENGGIIDDLIVYRTGAVPLPARRERGEPRGRLRLARASTSIRGSDVRDVSDEFALLAVQGPRALERLGLEHGAGVHLGDGRGRRHRGDGQPHRLHRRGGRRARLPARGRARALGRDPRARRHAVRPRRARHAAARGLLPAARQRHRPAVGRDLERPRLGLRARHGVHRRRARCARSRRAGPSGSSSRSG